MEKMFMRVSEVMEALDVSESYAYKLIRKLNKELEKTGCVTIPGRIDRKFFYLTVGSSFTEKKFSDICNATKCKSENYKLQKEWKDTITPKYKDILTNLNKGGILTFEMVRQ